MGRRSPALRIKPRGASRLLGNDCRCPRSGLCTDATCIRCVLPRRAVMRRLGCRCRVLPIPAWWLLPGSSRLYVLCPVERRNCSPSMIGAATRSLQAPSPCRPCALRGRLAFLTLYALSPVLASVTGSLQRAAAGLVWVSHCPVCCLQRARSSLFKFGAGSVLSQRYAVAPSH